MSKPTTPPPNSLFWTEDGVARHTRTTEDEKAFRDEQRRKHQKAREPHPIPDDGPCCHRCRRWRVPRKDGGFGECTGLVVAQQRMVPYVENGQVIARQEAAQLGIDYLLLPTRGNFACSAFSEYEEAAA